MNSISQLMVRVILAAEQGAVEEVAVASTFYTRLGAFADWAFSPVFHPINTLLNAFYEPWAQIVTVAYFLGAWIWVAFILKKEYVNLSCPYKTRLADLRIWTLVAMAPTLLVYIYFT